MAFVQKEGTFSLFINDRKTSPNHPDRRGEANVKGVIYAISGWIREGKKGKYLSGTIKPKQERFNAREQTGGEEDIF